MTNMTDPLFENPEENSSGFPPATEAKTQEASRPGLSLLRRYFSKQKIAVLAVGLSTCSLAVRISMPIVSGTMDIVAQVSNHRFASLSGYNTVAESNLTIEEKRTFDGEQALMTHYLAERHKLDQVIHDAGTNDDPASQRLQGFQKMIEKANRISDPRIRLGAIHNWVVNALDYDDAKLSHTKNLSEKQLQMWAQPAQETLRSGRGVCIDLSIIEGEALIRSKFAEEDVGLVYAKSHYIKNGKPITYGHTLLAVKIEDEVLTSDPAGQSLTTADGEFYKSPLGYYVVPVSIMGLDGTVYGAYSPNFKIKNNDSLYHGGVSLNGSENDKQLYSIIMNESIRIGLLPKLINEYDIFHSVTPEPAKKQPAKSQYSQGL